MNTSKPALISHVLLLCLVILAVLTLALDGRISGGEALAVIAAAGGVGVAGALGVSVGSKGTPPTG